ncbi:MAG: HNH endonuclease [Anaerolineae bacterium]|nr:HNH endonuclease [Anaerolineae bacterium]
MAITQSQRQIVRERARDCCEYCRLPAPAGTVAFHVDHIIPVKHGGSDDLDNLCLACYKCNAHKSHDLTGIDPSTGEIARLYHPRHQVWGDHFALQADMQIEGITPEGRTTIRVLQMNDTDRVANRQILAELGEYPCQTE